MKTAIIIHGFKSKPDTNWKPWLKSELEQHGFTVKVPEMPNTMHPQVAAWVEKLTDTVNAHRSDEIYLIGHSLGCITILKYLEQQTASNIKVCLFIAGFTQPFRGYAGGHDSFFEKKLDWPSIKKHCHHFVALHSKDDQNVPIEQLTNFKNDLNAETIVIDGFGHFSSENKITEVPIVREIILRIE
ncbi:MAG: YqiA/YcfP family alpha/beta fold hydrolase [Candidatus Saccharimonas sp.]